MSGSVIFFKVALQKKKMSPEVPPCPALCLAFLGSHPTSSAILLRKEILSPHGFSQKLAAVCGVQRQPF
jgi:hypothetical protein